MPLGLVENFMTLQCQINIKFLVCLRLHCWKVQTEPQHNKAKRGAKLGAENFILRRKRERSADFRSTDNERDRVFLGTTP